MTPVRTMTTFPPGRDWDILVIGGGIIGAGILLEAARRGLKALLVEQRDFAWGTSSRSSKLVHGGLRYLAAGSLRLTRDAVREREALLRAAPGLVEPQGFAFAGQGADGARAGNGNNGGSSGMMAVMRMVDMLSGLRRQAGGQGADVSSASRMRALDGVAAVLPEQARPPGGIRYTDAKTDDARLVLRVLDEARVHGATACNYVTVQSLVRDGGKVHGAMLRDERSQAEYAVRARVVVNATGAWSDLLGKDEQARAPRLRPLRGTHLVLPAWRLPLGQALSLAHPRDGRPVFVFPWEGVILAGTTDVDHDEALAREGRITRPEFDYLMEALRAQFPQLGLGDEDVMSTFASVRPVLDSAGGAEGGGPAAEQREHLVWSEPGMISVAGGKLTTFRSIALDVLRQVAPQLRGWQLRADRAPVFARVPLPARHDLPAAVLRRLAGRHGAQVKPLLKAAGPGELEYVPGTQTLWAELRWAARAEQVHRLDDLLLRRTRLGLQLPGGGAALLPRIRAICQGELGWSDELWEREQRTYLTAWRNQYGVPRPA